VGVKNDCWVFRKSDFKKAAKYTKQLASLDC